MNEFAIKGLINDWPPHIQPSCQNPLAALGRTIALESATMSNDALRRQAKRFLVFALRARETGNLPLADELTARAMDLFNEADSTADVSHTGRPVSPSTPAVPQEQQQQQRRLERNDDGEGE